MTQFSPPPPYRQDEALGGPPDRLLRPAFRHRRTPAWLWLLTVALIGTVAVLQSLDAGGIPVNAAEARAEGLGQRVPPPEKGGLVLFGKIGLLLRDLASKPGSSPQPGVDGLLETLDGVVGERSAKDAPPAKDDPLPCAAERIRSAIVAADLAGPDAALDRLNLVEADIAPDSDLHKDIAALRQVYTSTDPLSQDQQDGLTQRHGWFARLAIESRDPTAGPTRAAALSDAWKLMAFLVAVGGMIAVGFIAGLAMLIVAVISAAGGKLPSGFARERAAAEALAATGDPHERAGTRIWLETFALFVASFLTLKLVSHALDQIAPPHAPWLPWFTVAGQWALLLSLFWPVVRGMPWPQFRGEIGWHKGRGVFREIGAGLVAYLAAIPVYFFIAVICVLLMFVVQAISESLTGKKSHGPPAPPSKITDLISQGGLWFQIALATLVVIWAPVVEESVFRGALYRHFRSRLVVPLAALLTGVMFAAMHSYIPIQLVMVGALGVAFSLMREWRGSLIPSMTAHCLHNTMVLIMMTVVLRFMQF